MTETVHTQITEVVPKQGQKGPFWVIKYQGGSGTAWELELATKASGLIGQPAEIALERKGTFTNIRGVRPSSNGSQAVTEAPVASQGTSQKKEPDWDNKDRSIRQQNALGTAFRYASRLSDRFENLQELELFAFNLASKIYGSTEGDQDISWPAPTSDNSEEVVQQLKDLLDAEVVKKGVDW